MDVFTHSKEIVDKYHYNFNTDIKGNTKSNTLDIIEKHNGKENREKIESCIKGNKDNCMSTNVPFSCLWENGTD